MRDQDYRARILEDLSSGSFSSDAELFKIASLDVNSSRTTSVRGGQYMGVSHPPSCDYGEYEEYYEKSGSHRDNGVFTYTSDRSYYSEDDSYVSDGSPSRYSHGTSDDVFTYSSSHYPGSAYSAQDSISYAPARHNQARNVNRPSELPPRPNRQILACHATTTATKPAGSLLSPFFQCVNPTLPGEMGVPDGTPMRQKVSTMNALRSNDDALDSIFNAVERMSCRDEATLLQRNTKISTPHITTPHHIARAPPTPETIVPKSVPKKADVVQKKDDRDSLDVVFDGVERFACGVDPEATSKPNMQTRVVPQQRTPSQQQQQHQQQQPQGDALDRVFEGVEQMTCGASTSVQPTTNQSQSHPLTRRQQQKQDGLNRLFDSVQHYTCPAEATPQKLIQQPHWKYGNQTSTTQTTLSQATTTPRDPPAYKLEKKKIAGNDALDHFGNGFEYAVCRGNPAMVGKEGDMLDRVFDRFEANTCRQGNHSDGMDASYHSLDSTEFNNSIVEHVPSRHSRHQNRNSSHRSQPAEERLPPPTPRQQLNRASPQSRGTFKPDVLDLVFENVEAGLCRPSNKNRGERQRAKDLLERTRALRLQVEADVDFE